MADLVKKDQAEFPGGKVDTDIRNSLFHPEIVPDPLIAGHKKSQHKMLTF